MVRASYTTCGEKKKSGTKSGIINIRRCINNMYNIINPLNGCVELSWTLNSKIIDGEKCVPAKVMKLTWKLEMLIEPAHVSATMCFATIHMSCLRHAFKPAPACVGRNTIWWRQKPSKFLPCDQNCAHTRINYITISARFCHGAYKKSNNNMCCIYMYYYSLWNGYTRPPPVPSQPTMQKVWNSPLFGVGPRQTNRTKHLLS